MKTKIESYEKNLERIQKKQKMLQRIYSNLNRQQEKKIVLSWKLKILRSEIEDLVDHLLPEQKQSFQKALNRLKKKHERTPQDDTSIYYDFYIRSLTYLIEQKQG